MKGIVIVFLIVILAGFAFAQDKSPAIHPQPVSAGFSLYNPASNWRQFDEHSGMMQFHAGSNFFGSSLAYFTRGDGKLLYGINLNVMSIPTADDYLTGFYRSPVQTSALLFPLWFTLKLRLSDRSSSKFSPYIITGVGPTLALRFHNGSKFINALSEFNTEWGGGGYLGAGFDYLWGGEWAISADIRYNIIRFDNPVGLNRDYSGFSFAVGFLRAFGL
jgi:opacity protein-like surface antigen